MTDVASTRQCRLLCASGVAYGIDRHNVLEPPQPYYDAVGFERPPVPFSGGEDNVNACLVGTNADDGVILAFRGTLPPDVVKPRDLLDWLQDFLDKPVSYDGVPGKVHEGFKDALESLIGQALPEVRNQLAAAGPGAKLYVTGHSKGGGIAPIAGMKLAVEGVKADAVYTYAAPRAGDQAFAESYDLSTLRYENRYDVVPHVPPSLSLLGHILEQVPWLKDLFHDVETWNYQPVGELQSIDDQGRIEGDHPGLTLVRWGHLLRALLEGEFERIVKAHYHTCGQGYMTAICPEGVC